MPQPALTGEQMDKLKAILEEMGWTFTQALELMEEIAELQTLLVSPSEWRWLKWDETGECIAEGGDAIWDDDVRLAETELDPYGEKGFSVYHPERDEYVEVSYTQTLELMEEIAELQTLLDESEEWRNKLVHRITEAEKAAEEFAKSSAQWQGHYEDARQYLSLVTVRFEERVYEALDARISGLSSAGLRQVLRDAKAAAYEEANEMLNEPLVAWSFI